MALEPAINRDDGYGCHGYIRGGYAESGRFLRIDVPTHKMLHGVSPE
jgi:hypothetical protein